MRLKFFAFGSTTEKFQREQFPFSHFQSSEFFYFQHSQNRKMIIIFHLLVTLSLSQLNVHNLFCDGTFETYITSEHNDSKEWIFAAPSTPSCWHVRNSNATWEVKNITLDLQNIKGAELTTMSSNITLCHFLNLQVGSQYQLNLTMVTSYYMSYANLFVYANEMKIYNKSLICPNCTFNISTVFTAKAEKTQICFNDTHLFKLPGYIMASEFDTMVQNARNTVTGVFIDNLTLVIIPQILQDIIQIEANIQQLNGRIVFITNYTVPNPKVMNEIMKITQIYIVSEQQKNYIFSTNSANMLTVDIYPMSHCNLSDLKISIQSPNRNNSYLLKYQVIVKERSSLFQSLSKKQVNILKFTDPLGKKLVRFTKIGYKIISASFCSYFVISIFNFWNLSLMFNFLNLSYNPVFSREFLQTLAQIFYGQNSFIAWICDVFNLNSSAFNFNHYDRELIDKKRHYFQWFGFMSFSSNILSNNIETFLLLGLLIIKLLLLNLLQNCLSGKYREFFQKQKFKIVFLKQFLAFQSLIVISATSTILSLSRLNYFQTLNNIAQVIFLGVCFLITPIFYICSNKKLRKHTLSTNHSISLIPILSSKLKTNIQVTNQVLEYCLSISIPFLIVMDIPSIFLTVNSVLILLKAVYFFKFVQFRSKWEGFFGIIMNSIWILHTLTYSLLFATEKITSMGHSISSVYTISRYCGFITIGTIILGGSVEIMKLILEIAICLVKGMGKMFRYFYHKNSIQPEVSEIGKDEIERSNTIKVLDQVNKNRIIFEESINEDLQSQKNNKKNKKQQQQGNRKGNCSAHKQNRLRQRESENQNKKQSKSKTLFVQQRNAIR